MIKTKKQQLEQEMKHKELQQQLVHQEKARIQQVLTLHPVGSGGPCDVMACCILECHIRQTIKGSGLAKNDQS